MEKLILTKENIEKNRDEILKAYAQRLSEPVELSVEAQINNYEQRYGDQTSYADHKYHAGA